jgi:hypothetical protein
MSCGQSPHPGDGSRLGGGLAPPSCPIASDLIAVAFELQYDRLTKRLDQPTVRHDELFERYYQPHRAVRSVVGPS